MQDLSVVVGQHTIQRWRGKIERYIDILWECSRLIHCVCVCVCVHACMRDSAPSSVTQTCSSLMAITLTFLSFYVW